MKKKTHTYLESGEAIRKGGGGGCEDVVWSVNTILYCEGVLLKLVQIWRVYDMYDVSASIHFDMAKSHNIAFATIML